MVRVLILGLLLSVVFKSAGQQFGTFDTNPSSLRWRQINTSNFRILFPKGFDAQAQRMANTLEAIHAPEAVTLGSPAKKFTIVLQNQSAISNGFVSITPRRSEFYAMPPQDYNFLGNNDWLDLLATHEYRHMVQFQHANRGFNKVLYYLFGNNTLAAMSFLAVPQWFWEGDAVAIETAFTPNGRGRIPNFDVVLRTNLQEGRVFDYDKQYLRSFKHNITNHYVLGYNMVSYLRKRTNNPDAWGKITAHAWSRPFIPFAFSNAIRSETGLYVKDLYRAMAADLQQQYQRQRDSLTFTNFETINIRTNKAYTDYQYPQELEDGSVLTMKSGIGDIERFVTITNGVERKVFTPGFMNHSGMLSAVNSRLVWNEYRYDPRWPARNYSVIVSYDAGTKQKRTLSKESRFGSAALSPDGYQVAAVETTTDYATRLVVLDYFTGNVLKTFANPDNDFLSMPRWTGDGKEIVFLKTNRKGKSISVLRVDNDSVEDIAFFADENVGHPVPAGNFILYNSPGSGIDNIYAIERETGMRFQVTCSRYGAYNPSLSRDGKGLYYNEQTKNGMDVVKVPFDPSQWKVWKSVSDAFATATMLTEQEGHPHLLANVPQQNFPITKYARLSGIINPYSWGVYLDNTLAQADIGLVSRDVLSSTAISASYLYDIYERTGTWQAGLSYQAHYPIVDLQVTQGTREDNSSIFGRNVKFNWKESGLLGGVRIPWVLTRSKYNTQLEISNSVGLTRTSSFENQVSDRDGNVISTGTSRFVLANDTLIYGFRDKVDGTLRYNRFAISYAHAMKTSRRDFNFPFAHFLTYEFYNTMYGGDYEGRLSALRGAIYFPGLMKHHSLFFRGGIQQSLQSTDLNIYTFRNRIFKPRGFAYPRDTRFFSLSTNYQLPVWYPDIHLGPLLNIQRIKANLFFDYGSGSGRTYFYQQVSPTQTRIYFSDASATYQSMGAEITFDINIIRLLPLIELGVRGTYMQANPFNKGGFVFEFMAANIPF